MASYRLQFEMPDGTRKWGLGLSAVGLIALVIGIFTLAMSKDTVDNVRFWAVLLQNSLYFLMICNACMFFICANTLAWGGWQVGIKRVPEAISTMVPIFGILALIVLCCIIFNEHIGSNIYLWLNKEEVAKSVGLQGKSGFLNVKFFTIWSVISIASWWYFGKRMRDLGDQADKSPLTADESKKFIWNGTVRSSLYLVAFGLTITSTIPWLWLMSIDSHWYSTMYSWYTFASTFVSGLALIAIFVVFLKNKGYLENVTEEHLHDIGKYMFAFSIFWTYLWFSQYMLIWYANIPEETKYFQPRLLGNFRGIFFLNLILNFVSPFLIFMKRGPKRNYTMVTFVAIIIIFGHWLDFYQMIMPGLMGGKFAPHAQLSWFEFGIAMGYVGMMVLLVGKALAKKPLLQKFHPFFKESVIHHV